MRYPCYCCQQLLIPTHPASLHPTLTVSISFHTVYRNALIAQRSYRAYNTLTYRITLYNHTQLPRLSSPTTRLPAPAQLPFSFQRPLSLPPRQSATYHRQTARASAGLPTYVFPASKVIPFAPCAMGANIDPFFIVERPITADRSPSTHPSPIPMGCGKQEHCT